MLWRQNNPEVNYSPTRISGGGSVSRGSIVQEAKRDENRDLEYVGIRTGLGGPRIEIGGGCFECGNEPSGLCKMRGNS